MKDAMGVSKYVSNAAFTRAPICSLYVGLTTLANRRRSDGARLAGRHGIFYQHDGSRWCRITKRDTF